MAWVFWAIAAAAAIHVAEESLGGFLEWVRRFAPVTIERSEFVVVNAGFLALCLAAAAVGARAPWFSLSVASLILVNALVHLAGTVGARRYFPGLLSALLLYVPLGVSAYCLSARGGLLAAGDAAVSVLLGVAWQALPVAFKLASNAARRQV